MFARKPIQITGTVACLALSSTPVLADHHAAEREGEFGAFAGYHLFSDNNELGVVDRRNADHLEDSMAFGVRAAFAIAGLFDLEGELAIAPTSADAAATDVTQIGWRGHALFHILDGKVRPFALLGAGGSTASSADEGLFAGDTDFVYHGGLGVKVDVEDSWGLRFDARLLVPPSSASETVTAESEFFVGLYKTFGPFAEEAKKNEPPPDADKDGVPDSADQCIDQAEDRDGYSDEDGCPDLDNDGDGINDACDKCPLEAEDADGFEDSDGCSELDNDGDGVPDEADQCPMEREDSDGFEDTDGCPELDNDGDKIMDEQDQCPMEAETANGYQDLDGCPDEVPEKVKKFSGKIEGIRFQRNSAKIFASSFTVLDEAAAVFSEFGELRVEVQGHTDDTGSADRNTQLSQERAQAVVDYLVSKGIAADRLVAKGYGPSVPVGDNATKDGKELNRRVEFKLLSN